MSSKGNRKAWQGPFWEEESLPGNWEWQCDCHYEAERINIKFMFPKAPRLSVVCKEIGVAWADRKTSRKVFSNGNSHMLCHSVIIHQINRPSTNKWQLILFRHPICVGVSVTAASLVGNYLCFPMLMAVNWHLFPLCASSAYLISTIALNWLHNFVEDVCFLLSECQWGCEVRGNSH